MSMPVTTTTLLDLDAVEMRIRDTTTPRGNFTVTRDDCWDALHDRVALVREVRRLREQNERLQATWRHMVEHTRDPNTPDEWVADEARRVFADDGTAEREWREIHEEVRRLRAALADAIWRVEDGIGHKGAYLAEKYGDAEAVARYRAMLPAGALAGAEVGP
jgi:hypothetical protein